MIGILNNIFGITCQYISLQILKLFPKLNRQLKLIEIKVLEAIEKGYDLPEFLLNSLVAIEDKRYFNHRGVDFYSLIRALINNISKSRLQGASTITQQLVRCITEERDIKLKRKFREIIFAILINEQFSKGQILSAYLYTYKFKNCVGIREFCQIEEYNISNLSIKESAQIAARFKYPFINKQNYIRYLKRVRIIEIISAQKKYCTKTIFMGDFRMVEEIIKLRKFIFQFGKYT